MAETLGGLLRAKREALGLTLEDVEKQTHLRIRHLQAIESDDLTTIPSVTQAHGFIRSYSTFLGVRDEEIDARTGITRPRPKSQPSTSAGQAARPATKPRPVAAPSFTRRFLHLDFLLGVFMTVLTVGLLVWGGYHLILNFSSPSSEATSGPFLSLASHTATVGAPAGTPSADVSPQASNPADATPQESESAPATVVVPTAAPTNIPTPLGGVYTDVRVRLAVIQRAYLKVEVDGRVAFAGRVLPGDTCSPNPTCDFTGRQKVVVSTGNGAGVALEFNGIDLGPLGGFGQLVSRTFTPQGETVPTPAPPPIPSVTPTGIATQKP
jgi:cytoskeleton protein RodZ